MKLARFVMPIITLFAIAGSALAADVPPVKYTIAIEGITVSPAPILAWSWGLSNSGTVLGGGTGVGKANLQDLSFTKNFDANDPAIMNACFQGLHLNSVRLRGYKGSSTTPFLDIYMEEVLVTSLSTGGTSNNVMTSNVSLNFAKITINGVLLDQTEVTLGKATQMVASIMQRAMMPTAKQTVKSKITVR